MKRIFTLIAVCTIVLGTVNAQRIYHPTGGQKSSGSSSSSSHVGGASSSSYHNEKTVYNIPKAEYIISVAGTNQYWDIHGHPGYYDKSARVQVWSLDSGKDRKVMFIPAGDGFYYIKFQHNGYYLDAKGGQLNRGDAVQIWEPNRGKSQKWKVVHLGNGNFKFETVNGYVIDCAGGGWSDGTELCIWDSKGSRNQTFSIKYADTHQKFIP